MEMDSTLLQALETFSWFSLSSRSGQAEPAICTGIVSSQDRTKQQAAVQRAHLAA